MKENYSYESWEVGNIKIDKVKNKFSFGGDYMYEVSVDGRRQSGVSHNLDVALLIALAYKYDGLNSQFAYFANRMLGIEKEG